MTNFQLKLIALITMTIDHIGYFILSPSDPEYIYFRIIGRISFVLFAFLISEGMKHTRDHNRYIINLLIFALVIDLLPRIFLPIVGLNANEVIGFTNVFFTLGLGAFSIYLYQSDFSWYVKLISIFMCGVLSDMIGADYGSYGVFIIVSIPIVKNIFVNNKHLALLAQIFIYLGLTYVYKMVDIQYFGALAFAFIYCYNGLRGWYHPRLKYLIYIYYPVHIVILAGIGFLLGNGV